MRYFHDDVGNSKIFMKLLQDNGKSDHIPSPLLKFMV